MKKLIIYALLLLATSLQAQKGNVKSAKKALDAGDLEAALEAITPATQHTKTKGNPETWWIKGDIHRAEMKATAISNRPEALALEAYQKALELGDDHADAVMRVKLRSLKLDLMQQGNDVYANGDDDKALRYFQTGVKVGDLLEETSGEFHNMIANVYMGSTQFQLAAEAYMKSIEDGYRVEQQMPNALSVLRLANSPKFLEVMTDYRSRFPENSELKVREVDYRISTRELPKAQSLLEELVEEFPLDMNYRYFLGMVMLDQGDEGGVEHLQIRLRQNPNHLESLQLLGTFYFNQANEVNRELVELSDTDPKAEELTQKRNDFLKKVTVNLERAIRLNPTDRTNLQVLANTYTMLGDDANFMRINRKIKLLDE